MGENTPRPIPDDYADMNRDELIKLAIYQRERMEEMESARKESDRQNAELTDKLSALTEQLRKNNEAMSAMATQVSELMRQLKAEREAAAKLRSEVKVGRRHLFGRKSQKGTKAKDRDDENRPTPHTDVKEDFDGTPESLPDNLDVDVENKTTDVAGSPEVPRKESRLYRLGKTYRTMKADNHVYHRSDLGKLPEGAVVIKTYPRYTYDQKTVVTEHAHEIVVYRDKDGKVLCGYFPMDSEKDEPIIESVPGTHAAPDLMVYLVFLEYIGSLMRKAVDYLDHFWNQIFLYRKDGNYTIDNSLAERCIRPLANERKNSLFFGSDKMARVSAAYHSVVSTCKLQGYSILEYLKKFFAEITAGNRDYGKLMLSTISISANKL